MFLAMLAALPLGNFGAASEVEGLDLGFIDVFNDVGFLDASDAIR